MRLVLKAVHNQAEVGGIEKADLVGAGSEGLIKAVHRFDWRRGVKFSTYATWWVAYEIRDYIARNNHVVSVKRYREQQLARLYREIDNLDNDAGHFLTSAEVAIALDIPQAKVAGLLAAHQVPLSLYQTLSDESQLRLIDCIPNSNTPADEQAVSKIVLMEFSSALAKLTERQRQVFVLKYLQGYTCSEIIKKLKISKARVAKLDLTSRMRLRTNQVKEVLTGFAD
ncbi:sigma-70 family RNA polymerase sigma factor [Patescibacteria group bacterium]|nr:sigma-70 family RNA polymerase sigma factor [Patescibacteria group bacterium]